MTNAEFHDPKIEPETSLAMLALGLRDDFEMIGVKQGKVDEVLGKSIYLGRTITREQLKQLEEK